jgi:hypothetical protein
MEHPHGGALGIGGARHRTVGRQGHGRGRRTRDCMDLPATSPDITRLQHRNAKTDNRLRSGIQNPNFPFGRTPDIAWGKRSLREGRTLALDETGHTRV